MQRAEDPTSLDDSDAPSAPDFEQYDSESSLSGSSIYDAELLDEKEVVEKKRQLGAPMAFPADHADIKV